MSSSAPTEQPETADLWFQCGKDLMVRGKLPDAQEAFIKASQLCEEGTQLIEIGHALYNAGAVDNALIAYRRAGLFDDTLTEAKERVGAMLLELDDAEAAISFLNTAVEEHPKVPRLRLGFAQALHRGGREEEAHWEAKIVLSQDPSCTEAREMLRDGVNSKRITAKQMQVNVAFPEVKTVVNDGRILHEITGQASAITTHISEFPLPDLLQMMVGRRSTGHMNVFSDCGGQGVVGLLAGRLVLVSDSKRSTFWDYLLEKDILQASDIEEAKSKMTKSKTNTSGQAIEDGNIAKLLLEEKLADEESLREAILARIFGSLKTMLSWQDGHITFTRCAEEAVGETFGVDLDAQWSVFEALNEEAVASET